MFATSLLTVALCSLTEYAPGTNVIVYDPSTPLIPAVTNLLWLDECTTLVFADDRVGIQEMLNKRQIVMIPNRQQGLVIRTHRPIFSTVPDALFYELRIGDAKFYVLSNFVTTNRELADKIAEEFAKEAKQQAALAAKRAEIAAEEAYQMNLQEARRKGDFKTVAKMERDHQLAKNKKLLQAKKAREAKAFYGKPRQ